MTPGTSCTTPNRGAGASGRPYHYPDRGTWEQHAFDPRERAQAGVRSHEWTAVAQSEVAVIRELARCLRLIREERVPG